jgi:hypothetical protein
MSEKVIVHYVSDSWRDEPRELRSVEALRRPKTLKLDRRVRELGDVWERKHSSPELALSSEIESARRKIDHLERRLDAER